jgi:hypothetical protein
MKSILDLETYGIRLFITMAVVSRSIPHIVMLIFNNVFLFRIACSSIIVRENSGILKGEERSPSSIIFHIIH